MAGIEILKWSNSKEDQTVRCQEDEEVDSWLFMSSPVPVAVIIALYLYFILSLGPKLMETRKPYRLKYVMVLYNLYQVIFSAWLCSWLILDDQALQYVYNHSCSPVGRHNNPLVSGLNGASWWYFMSKLIELLDTVFFVLRKKQNQVSVLHVWHHTNMVISTWAYLKYVRGEQAIIPGFLNSFVHVIMYSYYLLAALGPAVQKYLWWKRYITTLQLGQFVVILLYLSTLLAFDCKVPRGLTVYMTGNTLIFLMLFLNFYRQAYFKNKKTA